MNASCTGIDQFHHVDYVLGQNFIMAWNIEVFWKSFYHVLSLMPSLFVLSPLLWNSQDLLYIEIYGIVVAWDFWMASTLASRFLSMVTISPSVVISIYAPIVKYFKIRQIVPEGKLYSIVQSSNYVGSNTMYAFVLSSFFYFFLEFFFSSFYSCFYFSCRL